METREPRKTFDGKTFTVWIEKVLGHYKKKSFTGKVEVKLQLVKYGDMYPRLEKREYYKDGSSNLRSIDQFDLEIILLNKDLIKSFLVSDSFTKRNYYKKKKKGKKTKTQSPFGEIPTLNLNFSSLKKEEENE